LEPPLPKTTALEYQRIGAMTLRMRRLDVIRVEPARHNRLQTSQRFVSFCPASLCQDGGNLPILT
jgi:hypothetical protein